MKFYLEDGSEVSRQEMVEQLLTRDGNRCMFPECTRPFDEDRHFVTIDHVYAQTLAKADGWEPESIHGIANLQLMGRSCNTRKGSFEYNDDGTLDVPARVPKLPKAKRPEYCKHCESGRLIFPGDTCEVCGIGAQPTTAPGVFKKEIKECSHSGDWHCRRCFVWEPELRNAR